MTDWSLMRPYAGKRLLDLALVLLTSPLWVPLIVIVTAGPLRPLKGLLIAL